MLNVFNRIAKLTSKQNTGKFPLSLADAPYFTQKLKTRWTKASPLIHNDPPITQIPIPSIQK